MDVSPGRDFVAIANCYARDVAKGKIVAGKLLRAACRRHLDDLKRWSGPRSPYYFDSWHVVDVCGFVELLPHVEGQWESPTIVLEPAQVWVLACVFGWRRREDGGRRFTDVYWEVARKNAKSTLSSALALYCLTCEGEQGPQIKCAATTGGQARIVFDVARKMVDRTPDLREAFGVESFANAIVSESVMGSIQPINAKASTQDGLNPHLAILDELHAHKTRDLYDVLKSARGARKNPLTWVITTAGYNLEGVCYEQRTLAVKVLEGVIEADHLFAAIYTIDEDDDPLDEACWPKANPLWRVMNQAEMRRYAQDARHSADQLQEFMTKRLNVWSGSKAAWLNLDKWKRCAGVVDVAELEGEPCWGGLDLAATTDIAAFVLAFPRPDGQVKVVARMYLPEATVAPRTERGNVPYQRWARDGWLTVTPGDVIDYDYIERDIREAMERFDVRGIAYDPWNAYQLTNHLMEDGAPLVEFRQGPKSYAPAMRTFERAVYSGRLEHGDNPVLTWMASNLVVRRDANDNLAPDKRNSAEKIDGIVALIMALGVADLPQEGTVTEIGEDYEVMVL